MISGMIVIGVIAVLGISGAIPKLIKNLYLNEFSFLCLLIIIIALCAVPTIEVGGFLFSIAGLLLLAVAVYCLLRTKLKLTYLSVFAVTVGIAFLALFTIQIELLAYAMCGIGVCIFLGLYVMKEPAIAALIAIPAVALGGLFATLVGNEKINIMADDIFSLAVFISVMAYLASKTLNYVTLFSKRKRVVG